MESNVLATCANGHQTSRLCTKTNCTNPSGICTVEDCQFFNQHKKCMSSCQAKDVLDSIRQFARSNSQPFDELILGTLNRMLKNIGTLKNEYIGLSNVEDRLQGKRKQLYELWKNGLGGEVKPQLVVDVINENQETSNSARLEKLKMAVERLEFQQRQGLKEVRKLFKGERKVGFDRELTNLSDVAISADERRIQRKTYGAWTFSLVNFAVSNNSNKITLRSVKKDSHLRIGLAPIDKLREKGFRLPESKSGLHLIESNGICFNSSTNQNMKKLNFEFVEGNLLEMEYLESSKELKITNLTTKQSVKLVGINAGKEDLYFCVTTFNDGDEWEIVQ